MYWLILYKLDVMCIFVYAVCREERVKLSFMSQSGG